MSTVGTSYLPGLFLYPTSRKCILTTYSATDAFTNHPFSAYMHDPTVYEDPDVFRPERFIRDGKPDFSAAPDPAKFIFGFGRRYVTGITTNTSDICSPQCVSWYPHGRICPGRHFGMNGLFINVASVLHVFDITPPVDEEGQAIKIEPRLTNGLLWYVNPKTLIVLLSHSCSVASYPADCRCTIKPRSTQAETLILEAQSFH